MEGPVDNPSDANAGGQGGQEQYQLPPSLNPGGQTSDTRLIARAIKERWPITPEMRQAVVVQLAKVVVNRNGDVAPREMVAAARALIAADKINLEEQQGPAAENHLHLHSHETRTVIDELDRHPEFQQ